MKRILFVVGMLFICSWSWAGGSDYAVETIYGCKIGDEYKIVKNKINKLKLKYLTERTIPGSPFTASGSIYFTGKKKGQLLNKHDVEWLLSPYEYLTMHIKEDTYEYPIFNFWKKRLQRVVFTSGNEIFQYIVCQLIEVKATQIYIDRVELNYKYKNIYCSMKRVNKYSDWEFEIYDWIKEKEIRNLNERRE